MDVIRKAVKRSPKPFGKNGHTTSSSKQHKKLAENWTDTREPVKDGMTFYVKYVGSTLVEELNEGESYGDRVSSNAVTTIVNMAKMSGKKMSKVALIISTKGITVIDMETKEVYVQHSIYRICFCTASSGHDKMFAYIARNTDNETIECYAFVCDKKKIAEAVTLTVAQTFSLAREEEEGQQEQEYVVQNIANLNLEDRDSQHSTASESGRSSGSNSPAVATKFAQSPLQQPESHPAAEEPRNTFDEEDEFSSLALSRHQKDQGGEASLPSDSGFPLFQPSHAGQSFNSTSSHAGQSFNSTSSHAGQFFNSTSSHAGQSFNSTASHTGPFFNSTSSHAGQSFNSTASHAGQSFNATTVNRNQKDVNSTRSTALVEIDDLLCL